MDDKIGRYEIIKELGRGGMGVVYLARDPHLDRNIVIKKILFYGYDKTQHEEALKRFRREAKAIANLDHPAIIPIYDYGIIDEQPYLVMKFVSGGSLADRLKDGALPILEVNRILQIVAPAIDYIHDKKIIHRDLKPANILFDDNNNPYVADFGLVKIHAESPEQHVANSIDLRTSTGITMGTPAYMSPEQVEATAELDRLSDIYSLGVIVYQMLTGALPYKADSSMGTALMHIKAPIPDIRKTRTDLPATAQKLINRAMAKNKHNRYQQAGELALAVAELAQEMRRHKQTGGVNGFTRTATWLGASGFLVVALMGCLLLAFVALRNQDKATPTPIPTDAPTLTLIPTFTPEPPTATATLPPTAPATETKTITPTKTPVPSPTPTPRFSPTPVSPTPTLVPTLTATASRLPVTNTPRPTAILTATPIPATPIPPTNPPPTNPPPTNPPPTPPTLDSCERCTPTP